MPELNDLVLSIRAAGIPPVVLLDGGSGAGKSTLARVLAPALGAELVRLDDLYPGWDGLQAASRAVADELLPRRRWRRWDWASGRSAEWHELDPSAPLLVEGAGALSRASRQLATFALWIDLEPGERKRRALERDGDVFAPHWDRWAAQEDAFFSRERPDLLADLILDGETISSFR
ncbi:ATP-binding protein [Naasia aerilata]|uniref:Adenylate kinase n=1 Tax=Naasia aerilata TaxID=1162966 RepID=A0ABM8GDU7_9MICO|nr:ATP-binding protein [Naasia aerilata]BDZ46462.1 adenylate kinase [Naasia aerilata]